MAIAVPLSVMVISDLKFGGYNFFIMMSVYTCLMLPAFAGPWLKSRLQAPQKGVKTCLTIGVSGLLCSIAFFVVTNLTLWCSGSMYPNSMSGLMLCFSQAIPFFRHTLMGDMVFAFVFLGGYTAAVALGISSQERVGESFGDQRSGIQLMSFYSYASNFQRTMSPAWRFFVPIPSVARLAFT